MSAAAEFQEVTVTLGDGYPAYARFWGAPQPRGALLHLHGIQSHCGWYEQSAARLCRAGYAVLQPDRRGSGRNPAPRGHARSCGELIDDARCCLTWLQRRTGRAAADVLGISWGGRLAVALCLAEPAGVHSLTLVSPGLFPKIDVSPAQKFRIGVAMLGDGSRQFDIPLNDPELFTSQPRWIEFLRRDRLALHQVSAAFLLATRRLDSAIRGFPAQPPRPVHLLVGSDDRIIDVPRTVEYVTHLNWPQTRITRYTPARHTLEFEAVAEDYCNDVVEWLESLGNP